MAEIPRQSVVSILKSLLATEDEMARQSKSPSARDYHEGRASGLRSALEVLAMNEDEFFRPVASG